MSDSHTLLVAERVAEAGRALLAAIEGASMVHDQNLLDPAHFEKSLEAQNAAEDELEDALAEWDIVR